MKNPKEGKIAMDPKEVIGKVKRSLMSFATYWYLRKEKKKRRNLRWYSLGIRSLIKTLLVRLTSSYTKKSYAKSSD